MNDLIEELKSYAQHLDRAISENERVPVVIQPGLEEPRSRLRTRLLVAAVVFVAATGLGYVVLTAGKKDVGPVENPPDVIVPLVLETSAPATTTTSVQLSEAERIVASLAWQMEAPEPPDNFRAIEVTPIYLDDHGFLGVNSSAALVWSADLVTWELVGVNMASPFPSLWMDSLVVADGDDWWSHPLMTQRGCGGRPITGPLSET